MDDFVYPVSALIWISSLLAMRVHVDDKRYRKQNGQSRMDNLEKTEREI